MIAATVFVGGGYPGAKITTTSLERDSGTITARIDLGADNMGGLFLESLDGDAIKDAISTVVVNWLFADLRRELQQ